MNKHFPKIIAIFLTAMLLTSCCQGILVHTEEVCTLVKYVETKYTNYYYYYIPSISVVACQSSQTNSHYQSQDVLPCTPRCGDKYLITYSYHKCGVCNSKGKYDVKEVYLIGEPK